MKYMISLLIIVGAASASAQTLQLKADELNATTSSIPPVSNPTVEDVVTLAILLINLQNIIDNNEPVCVEYVLVREAVVVAIPCRLPGGGFDHSFWRMIDLDQRIAKSNRRYKRLWRKSPAIIAKIWGDGSNAFRQTKKQFSLEADRYDYTDKNIPDYIWELMKKYVREEQEGGPTAPPYFWKMDVDPTYGAISSFIGDMKHLLLRMSKSQKKLYDGLLGQIAELKKKSTREFAVTGNK